VFVGHIGTEKRYTVDPEGVEGVDAIGSLRTLTKSPGDTLIGATTSTGIVMRARWPIRGGERKRVVDEVGVWGTISGEEMIGRGERDSQTT
jgi:hypothetical protein